VNIWRTTYQHVLKDAGAIVEWVKGTGLQPYLHRITSSSAKEAFLSEYEKKLKDAYPELSDGSVLLAYPRLFVVAVRK
jgi:trans-aconitate 2-methyltransferase